MTDRLGAEGPFLLQDKAFDGGFASQRFGSGLARFAEDGDERAASPGVARALPGGVGGEALHEVVRRARVERSVGAADDVDAPHGWKR